MNISKSLYKIILNANLKRLSHKHFIQDYNQLNKKNQIKLIRKITTNEGNTIKAASAVIIETPTERMRNYWTPHLEDLNKEESKLLFKQLDLNYILGIHPENGKKIACFRYFEEEKKLNPLRIILVRIGDFYEAIGIDAVIILNVTDIAAFNNSYNVPRIKCSLRNRDELLKVLVTECGLEIVICEESDKFTHRKKWYKTRFVSQILTPLCPVYHRTDLTVMALDDTLMCHSPMAAAIAWSETGYILMQYNQNGNSFRKISRLTEEGLLSRLYAIHVTPPLYLHNSIFSISSNQSSEMKKWEKRMRKISPKVIGPVKIYHGIDPMLKFSYEMIKSVNNENIRILEENMDKRTGPPPMSTVTELGLENETSVDMLNYIIQSSNKQIKGWIKRLIMIPPTKLQVECIRFINEKLITIEQPLPNFKLNLSANQIIQMIRSGSGDAVFFRSLRDLICGVLEILKNAYFDDLSDALMKVIEVDIDKCDKKLLESHCLESLSLIIQVVNDESYSIENNQKLVLEQFMRSVMDPIQIKSDLIKDYIENIKQEFNHISNLLDQIELIFNKHKFNNYYFQCNVENKDIWIKIIDNQKMNKQLYEHFKRPIDKKGIEKKGSFYTTHELENAILNLKSIINDMENAINDHLTNLCNKLILHLSFLIQASHLALAIASLSDHVRTAFLNKWKLPEISNNEDLIIEDFWPYWMSKDDPNTIKNSIKIKDVMILTGSNMGGKSTILRSIAAICCLSSSGLYVPAEMAKIPFIDSVILKTFNRDSPMENKSSFAIEMQEMSSILQDATKDTLFLIDELGKGTEIIAGTSLSAAILDELANNEIKGIFATHLHKLRYLIQNNENISLWQMALEIDSVTKKKKQTWKIKEGCCEDSMGFDLAIEEGIDIDLVKRSQEIIISSSGT